MINFQNYDPIAICNKTTVLAVKTLIHTPCNLIDGEDACISFGLNFKLGFDELIAPTWFS